MGKISRTLVGGSYLLQISSRCILRPQPNGQDIQDTRWWFLPPANKQSVYSTAPAEWARYPGHSLVVLTPCKEAVGVFYGSSRMGKISRTLVGGSYLLQISSRCILRPQPNGQDIQDTRWWFLPPANKQSVYSTAPAEWARYPGHSLVVPTSCK